MPQIFPRGNPQAPIWLLLDAPYNTDIPKGYLLSGGMGYVFERMLVDSGLSWSDVYAVCRRPYNDSPDSYVTLASDLAKYAPPLILAMGNAAAFYLPELREKGNGALNAGQLQKYAGSLLQSKMIPHPHYMMPLYSPDYCIADWTERNVTTFIDLQKLRDELVFWKRNSVLCALPIRTLIYGDLSLGDILHSFDRFRAAALLSIDIETVYPRDKSAFHPHPGYPVTIGIADSASYGLSFNLFRDSPDENRLLWKALDLLLREKAVLGQNFFNFDALFFNALGFEIALAKVKDTLIRHHILWPELSHKLQFMTRQYTREPYYKDEGAGWSVKNMDRLRRYNCLDVCVTYEIYEAQEQEFNQRPHLR